MLSKIILFLSVILLSQQFAFTPNSLYSYYTEEYIFIPSRRDYSNKIIDPNDFLKNYQQIMEKLNEIELKKSINIIVVFVQEIDKNYKQIKSNPIREFGSKFGELYFQDEKEMEAESMIIVFSVEDRKMRISVGHRLRNIYTDFYNGKLKESITTELKNHNFDKALLDLLDEILNFEAFRSKVDPSINVLKVIIGGLIGIFFMVVFIRYCGWCRCCIEKTIEYRINEVNEIIRDLEKSKGKEKEVTEEYCMICLGNINEERLTKFDDDEPDEVELEVKDDKNSKFSELLFVEVDEGQSESQKTPMDCGHIFHKGCLDAWKKKSKECPICQKKIEKFRKDIGYKQSILDIHKSVRPELHNCNITYEKGRYIAKKKVSIWFKKHVRRPENNKNNTGK